MRALSFFRRPPIILHLNSADAESLAHLHAQAFYHNWNKASFESFLQDPTIIAYGAQLGHGKRALSGFILARIIADEAEILTFAVAQKHRRTGIGRQLLEHLLRFLYKERVKILFLEVDENNIAALALYRALGFQETGRRKAYYQAVPNTASRSKAQTQNNGNGKRSDAILFEYHIKQPNTPI